MTEEEANVTEVQSMWFVN